MSDNKLPNDTKELVIATHHRHTTDPLFFLILLGFWIAMTIIGAMAIKNGNINRLLGPIDSNGNVCGFDPGYIETPYFYTVMSSGLGSCVSSCPTQDASITSIASTDYICLNIPLASQTISKTCQTSNGFEPSLYCFCNLKRSTINQFNRCRFTDITIAKQFGIFNASIGYFQSFISDILTSRIVIFCFGFLLSLGLSFLIIFILRYQWFGLIFIWNLVIMVLLLLVVLTVLAYETAIRWQNANPQLHSDTAINALKAFSLFLAIISFLYTCLMIAMRRNINIGIKVISLAANAINDMPMLVFSPIIQVIGFVFFFVPFIIYCFFLGK